MLHAPVAPCLSPRVQLSRAPRFANNVAPPKRRTMGETRVLPAHMEHDFPGFPYKRVIFIHCVQPDGIEPEFIKI